MEGWGAKGLPAPTAAALPAQPCTLGLDHPAAASWDLWPAWGHAGVQEYLR